MMALRASVAAVGGFMDNIARKYNVSPGLASDTYRTVSRLNYLAGCLFLPAIVRFSPPVPITPCRIKTKKGRIAATCFIG